MSVVLVAVILCMSLAACGKKLSGKYSAEIPVVGGVAFTFNGSKVTITITALGQQIASVEGKYSIKDDQITLTFESEDEKVEEYNGTFTFAETEKGIKIGLVEYRKAD